MAMSIASEKLVSALTSAGAPAAMIQRARYGVYADWLITYDQRPGAGFGHPVSLFEHHGNPAGLNTLIAQYKAGVFNG